MKDNKKRSKSRIARDRKKMASMYLRGELQADIGGALGLTQATVSRDLKVLQSEWLESAAVDIDKAKSKELAKIDDLELEYWEGWRKSQEDAIRTQQEEKEDGLRMKIKDGENYTVTDIARKKVKTTTGQYGNPAFLRGIEWCINKRCDILGLDAPKQTDITSGGKPIVYEPSQEERERRLIEILDAARERRDKNTS